MERLQNSRYRQWFVPILLSLLLISFILHLWTLTTLSGLRLLARDQMFELSREIEQIEDDVIEVNVNIDQEVPIRAQIPVQQQVTVPINTSVALNEEVELNLDNFVFDVPLNLDVPISTTVPITIDETVAVSTTVDLELTAPLSIAIRDTSLAAYLADLRQTLIELGEQL
jgi:hypothetical protein